MPYEVKLGFLAVVALLITLCVWMFDQGLAAPSAEKLGMVFIGGWFMVWLWWISAVAANRDWLHHGVQFLTSLLIFGTLIGPIVQERSISLPCSAALALAATLLVARHGARIPR